MNKNTVIGFYGAILGICDQVDKILGADLIANKFGNTKDILNMELGRYLLYVGTGASSLTDEQADLINLCFRDRFGEKTAWELNCAADELSEPDPDLNASYAIFNAADSKGAEKNGNPNNHALATTLIKLYELFGELMVQMNENWMSQYRYETYMNGLRARQSADSLTSQSVKPKASESFRKGRKTNTIRQSKTKAMADSSIRDSKFILPKDALTPDKFKGIHHVKGHKETISPFGTWTLDIPTGFSYTMDPDYTARAMLGGNYYLQIQSTNDYDFSQPYESSINLAINPNVFSVEIEDGGDDLRTSYAEEAIKKAQDDRFLYYEIFLYTPDVVILYDDSSRDDERITIGFKIISAGWNAGIQGQIELVAPNLEEHEKKALEILSSIGIIRREYSSNKYTPFALPPKLSLCFNPSKSLEIAPSVKLPIPEGFHATDDISRTGGRGFIMVPEAYPFSRDPMKADIGISGASGKITLPDHYLYTQMFLSLKLRLPANTFDEGTACWFVRISDKYAAFLQNNFDDDDPTWILYRIMFFAGNRGFVFTVRFNFEIAGTAFAAKMIDTRTMVYLWLKHISQQRDMTGIDSAVKSSASKYVDEESSKSALKSTAISKTEADILQELKAEYMNCDRPASFAALQKEKPEINWTGLITYIKRTYNLTPAAYFTAEGIIGAGKKPGADKNDQRSIDKIKTEQQTINSSSEILVIDEGETVIAAHEYAGTNYNYVVFPKSLRTVREGAFENCMQLENVEIMEGLTSIGAFAFGNCPKLHDIFLPVTIERIDRTAFVDERADNEESHITVHLSAATAERLEKTKKYPSVSAVIANCFEINGKEYADLSDYVSTTKAELKPTQKTQTESRTENATVASKRDRDNSQKIVQDAIDQTIKKGIIEDSSQNRDAVAAATTFVYEAIVKPKIEQAKSDLQERTQKQKDNGQKIIHIPSSARIDYPDDALYEAALNRGEKTEGKIVRFKVLAVKPKSEFGFNLWAGEHLNFCTQEGFPVKEGDTILAKVSKVDHCIGSWIIYYDRLDYETRTTPLNIKDRNVYAYHPDNMDKAGNNMQDPVCYAAGSEENGKEYCFDSEVSFKLPENMKYYETGNTKHEKNASIGLSLGEPDSELTDENKVQVSIETTKDQNKDILEDLGDRFADSTICQRFKTKPEALLICQETEIPIIGIRNIVRITSLYIVIGKTKALCLRYIGGGSSDDNNLEDELSAVMSIWPTVIIKGKRVTTEGMDELLKEIDKQKKEQEEYESRPLDTSWKVENHILTVGNRWKMTLPSGWHALEEKVADVDKRHIRIYRNGYVVGSLFLGNTVRAQKDARARVISTFAEKLFNATQLVKDCVISNNDRITVSFAAWYTQERYNIARITITESRPVKTESCIYLIIQGEVEIKEALTRIRDKDYTILNPLGNIWPHEWTAVMKTAMSIQPVEITPEDERQAWDSVRILPNVICKMPAELKFLKGKNDDLDCWYPAKGKPSDADFSNENNRYNVYILIEKKEMDDNSKESKKMPNRVYVTRKVWEIATPFALPIHEHIYAKGYASVFLSMISNAIEIRLAICSETGTTIMEINSDTKCYDEILNIARKMCDSVRIDDSTNEIYDKAYPETIDYLHEHYDLVNSGRYTTHRDADFVGQPISMLLERNGQKNNEVYRLMKISGDSYNLYDKAISLAKVFRMEAGLFDSKRDTEALIRKGMFLNVGSLHSLRSLAWEICSKSYRENKELSQYSFEELKEIGQYIQRNNNLLYDGTYSAGLCNIYDWHVFYVTDDYLVSEYRSNHDLRRLTGKENRGGNAISISFSRNINDYSRRINDIISRNEETVASLELLREELTELLPIMETIHDGMLVGRDRKKPLEGPLAEALTAWCALAIAAKEPFYSEEAANTPEANAGLKEPLERPTDSLDDRLIHEDKLINKKRTSSSVGSTFMRALKNDPLFPDERCCDLCGRQIEEDEEYETLADGEYVCTECEASICGKCSNCDQIYRKEELTEEEDGYYCPDCHEEYFAQCEECGKMTLKEDLALVGSKQICPNCFSDRKSEIVEGKKIISNAVDHATKKDIVQKEHIKGETIGTDANATYLLFKTLNEQILNNVEEQARIDTGLLSWKLTTIDYPDEDDFEKALSNGALVERKTVCFKVIDIIPKSEYGFKLNAGEHLCFVSKHKVDVNAGQFVTVRAVKTVNLFGTWFITYDLLKVTNTRVAAEIKEDKQQKHETAQTVTPVVDSSSYYLVIREGKSIIREQEFAGSNYKYIGLPKSLKFIEKGAFENCPMLENIGIKEGLTSIDAYAFSNCPELREIHLPETTKYIDENAFVDRGSENRSHIVVHLSGDTAYSLETTRKFYSRNAFTAKRFEIDGRKYQDLASYVKEKDEKRAAEEKAIWNTEKPAVKEVKATPHKLEIQEGITRISNREYAKSTYISVKLPKSLREIGSYAFESCPELRAVEMQEGLNIIGPYAFSNCPNLQHIYLPESIQSVDRTAFVEEEANLGESHITVHMSGNTAMHLEKKNRFSSVSTIVARDFVIAGERYTDISDYTGVRKAEESEAEKRRKEINEQIYKLIAERDSIKGLFSGMKRKKIQKVIDELRNQLEKL